MKDRKLPFDRHDGSRKAERNSVDMSVLINYLSKFVDVNEKDAEALLEGVVAKHFKKGEILLRENQVSNYCYFVLKGCVRQYYLVDGEEKTTNFYTEGMPITLHECVYKKQASKYFLACLEDCVLTIGTGEEESGLMDLKFEPVCRMATEEELNKYQELLSMYIINSPEERYLNLLKTRPDLIDRVPQYQLASFLGITPESLSRIRKRLMQKA